MSILPSFPPFSLSTLACLIFPRLHKRVRTTAMTALFWNGWKLCDIKSCCGAYCKCGMLLTTRTIKTHGFTLRQNGWRATWHLRVCGCNLSQSVVMVCYFPLHKAQKPPRTKQYALSEKLKVPTQITTRRTVKAWKESNLSQRHFPSVKSCICAKTAGPMTHRQWGDEAKMERQKC